MESATFSLQPYSHILINHFFPKFSLKNLKDFSSISKEGFELVFKYFLTIEGNITKRSLREIRFSLIEKKEEMYFSTNQAAITRKYIFGYYGMKTNQFYMMYINLVDTNSMKTIDKLPIISKLASKIVKLIPQGHSLYVYAEFWKNKKIISKRIIKVDIRHDNKLELYKSSLEINLPKTNTLMEVFGDKIFIDSHPNIQIFDRETFEIQGIINLNIKDPLVRIIGIKVNNGFIYIRSTDGLIRIYDLETKKSINTIVGPDDTTSLDHFEVQDNYFYIAGKDCTVSKWKFTTKGEINKVHEINYFGNSNKSTQSPDRFNFQIDEGIVYLCLPGHSLRAHDCQTFKFLREINFKASDPKWQIQKNFINEGIIFSLFSKKQHSVFRDYYLYAPVATNTNYKFEHYIPAEVEQTSNTLESPKAKKARKLSTF